MGRTVRAFVLVGLLWAAIFLIIARFADISSPDFDRISPIPQAEGFLNIGRLEALNVERLPVEGFRFHIVYRDAKTSELQSKSMDFDSIEDGVVTLNMLIQSFPRYAQR